MKNGISKIVNKKGKSNLLFLILTKPLLILHCKFNQIFYIFFLGGIGKRCNIEKNVIIRGNLNNIYLEENVLIKSNSIIECNTATSNICIGSNTVIHEYSMILSQNGSIKIGSECSINPFSVLYGTGGLMIGNFVRIAAHTVIVPANHIFDDEETPICNQGVTSKGIVIEDDVWIGSGVKILDGCKIGKGSVIGAGTVLTKSVEPYSVVAGIPGKVLYKRGRKIKI